MWLSSSPDFNQPGLLALTTFVLDKICVDQVKFYSKVGTYIEIWMYFNSAPSTQVNWEGLWSGILHLPRCDCSLNLFSCEKIL